MKMKRFLSLTCAAALLFSLSACNGRELPPYLRNPETTAPTSTTRQSIMSYIPTTSTTEPTTVTITRPLTYQLIAPGFTASVSFYPNLEPYCLYSKRSDGAITQLYDEPIRGFWKIENSSYACVRLGDTIVRVSTDGTSKEAFFDVEGEVSKFQYKNIEGLPVYVFLTEGGLYTRIGEQNYSTSLLPIEGTVIEEKAVLTTDGMKIFFLTEKGMYYAASKQSEMTFTPMTVTEDDWRYIWDKDGTFSVLIKTVDGFYHVSEKDRITVIELSGKTNAYDYRMTAEGLFLAYLTEEGLHYVSTDADERFVPVDCSGAFLRTAFLHAEGGAYAVAVRNDGFSYWTTETAEPINVAHMVTDGSITQIFRKFNDDIFVFWDLPRGSTSFNPNRMTLHVFVPSRGRVLTGAADSEKWKYPMLNRTEEKDREYVDWIYSLCDEEG